MDARTPDSDVAATRDWRPDRCDRVALVLQGGGALGAYQVGVYQALHEGGMEPDWVCGVSIGAINSAIIAGNPPEQRLEKLQIFWDRITARKVWHYTPDGDIYRKARNLTSSWLTTTWASPASSSRTRSIRGSAPPAQNPRPAITIPTPLRRDLAGAGRFRPDQFAKDPFRGRRGQRADRQLPVFRQQEGSDRPRACDGERRAAAGAADGEDRHRSFLGRRHRIQYAAAASARPGRPA